MRLSQSSLVGLFLFLITCGASWGQEPERIQPGLKLGEKPAAVALSGYGVDREAIEEQVATPAEPTHQYTVVELFQPYCRACRLNMLLHLPELLEKSSKTTTYKLVALWNPNFGSRDDFTREVKDFLSLTPEEMLPDASADEKARLPEELPKVRVLLDTKTEALRAFKVTATPTLYVLDRNGKVVYAHVGSLEGQAKEKKALLELLAK